MERGRIENMNFLFLISLKYFHIWRWLQQQQFLSKLAVPEPGWPGQGAGPADGQDWPGSLPAPGHLSRLWRGRGRDRRKRVRRREANEVQLLGRRQRQQRQRSGPQPWGVHPGPDEVWSGQSELHQAGTGGDWDWERNPLTQLSRCCSWENLQRVLHSCCYPQESGRNLRRWQITQSPW